MVTFSFDNPPAPAAYVDLLGLVLFFTFKLETIYSRNANISEYRLDYIRDANIG